MTTVVDTGVTATVPVYEPEVGDVVIVELQTPPTNGTAVVTTNGAFTYTPNTGFTGTDTFTVEACEVARAIGCDDATVTVTVIPIANPNMTQTPTDTPVDIEVTDDDLGTIGPPTITIAPTSGTAVVQPGRTVTYTPTPGSPAWTCSSTRCARWPTPRCATARRSPSPSTRSRTGAR